jgi:serine/threonine-protein kinase
MGEVYKARDTRLGRIVAIKLCKEQFSERFERETRAVAALNHPNICQLYDVGPNYLVMEYVEGETLKGPLKLEEAMPIIRQLIDGIEAAHDRNIVHRDLKPANIKITPEGVVKILDFGLAKASAPEPEGNPETSSTITMDATVAGTVLGTAGYMAPEQARGKPADKRSDVWSFGVVVYELLTGKRAFQGESVVETLGAVIHQEPDWGAVPERARRLLRWCLEKDPRRRLQAIGDARRVLEEFSERVVEAPAPSRGSWLAWSVAAALALALAVLAWAPWRVTQPVEHPLVRLDVDLGNDVSLGSYPGAVILSPDGSRLVYVSQSRLFTRRLDQPKATELPSGEGAYAPFFSPDGQWVAFFSRGKLEKVSVQGGAAIALCNASGVEDWGSWGEDGNIIVHLGTGPLFRISSAGGAPAPVTELAPGETTHRWPQVLPGGRAVLFTAFSPLRETNSSNIEVMSLGDRRRKTLLRGGTYGRYISSGHLVYMNSDTLLAVPFDPNRLEVHGVPLPVLQGVSYSTLDFSRTGTLVYRGTGAGDGPATVQWLDSAGKTQPLLAKPGDYLYPTLSPDGNRLALTSAGDIWVYEWHRDAMMRLTFGGGSIPVWSPDGRYIAFQAAGGTFWTRSDGSSKPQPLTQSKNPQAPWSFTTDGKRLAFDELNPGSERDLWTVPLESNAAGLRAGKPEVFLQTSFDERHPSFSPDGRWLAYTSNESGTYQVYVRAFPGVPSGPRGKWMISTGSGLYPVWSRNGRELFFRNADGQVMVAAYTVHGDSFTAGKPRMWFEKSLANPRRNYDVAPDGNRIIAVMPVEGAEGQPQHHVIFLLNFFDYLRQRVPMEK